MTLKKRGNYWYGEDHTDVRVELARYSKRNGYPVDAFVDIKCKCGKETFQLFTDNDEGVAIRKCTMCSYEHLMGDSADFADGAEVRKHECVCGSDVFQITAGIHRYRNEDDSLSDDVRWLYLGCRCPSCGLVGCYADWKNEFEGWDGLLAMM